MELFQKKPLRKIKMKKATEEDQDIPQWDMIFPTQKHAAVYIYDVAVELAKIAEKYDMPLAAYFLEMAKYDVRDVKSGKRKTRE